MPVLRVPVKDTKFTLDTSSVAGFFGGDDAVQAMTTVHLSKGRMWVGWYNSPGSYFVAKEFGKIAASGFWDALFPGPNETPAVSFGLDGRVGPKYVALLSGTEIQSGHLGYLTMKIVEDFKNNMIEIKGRETAPCKVAFLELGDIKYDQDVPKESLMDALLALIPILASCSASVMCALVEDWYCFAMIVFGMVSSGVTCLVIGSGKLTFSTVQNPAKGAPPGHGILTKGNTVIVVKGEEKNVNAVTKGKFSLQISGEPRYCCIGFCAFLLLLQFLLQLLLIPQGSFFGQLMFLASIVVSWIYNSYLASREKENIQAKVLSRWLGLKPSNMHTFKLGTRSTMAVFVCLLCNGIATWSPHEGMEPGRIIRSLIPNSTEVWERWRAKVVQQIKSETRGSSLTCLEVNEDDQSSLSTKNVELLADLLKDAKSAFNGYYEHHNPDSSANGIY